MDPLISMIVITYNSAKTVEETLESVYSQTYQRLELIIADDASKDDTVDIVQKWINKHQDRFERTIVSVAVENGGIVSNCNRAIELAHGEYVQSIAGDDLFLPECVRERFDFAQKNQVELVFSKVEIFGTNIQRMNDMKRFCKQGYRNIQAGYESQKKAIFMDNIIGGPAGGFIKKSYLDSCGGYDRRFPMLEDYPFVYKYIMDGHEIILLDKVLAMYRITGQSVCTTTGNVFFARSCNSFFWKVKFWDLVKAKEYTMLKQNLIYCLQGITH